MSTLTFQIIAIAAFLMGLLSAAVTTAAICFFLWKLASSISSGVATQSGTVSKFSEAIEKLTFIQERTAKEVQSIQDLPVHVLAYAKMAAALVKEIHKFREAVDSFRAVVLKTDGKKIQDLIYPDVDEANNIFEVQSLLANNPQMTEEEARTKVAEANEREMQLSLD